MASSALLSRQKFLNFAALTTYEKSSRFQVRCKVGASKIESSHRKSRDLSMVAFDRPPADIVLCVEGTANLGAYIEDLKQNYILPTLTYVYILIFASIRFSRLVFGNLRLTITGVSVFGL